MYNIIDVYYLFNFLFYLFYKIIIIYHFFIFFLVNIEDTDFQKSKQDSDDRKKIIAPRDDYKGKRKDNGEKATDDYHYERFKKQFRRF